MLPIAVTAYASELRGTLSTCDDIGMSFIPPGAASSQLSPVELVVTTREDQFCQTCCRTDTSFEAF